MLIHRALQKRLLWETCVHKQHAVGHSSVIPTMLNSKPNRHSAWHLASARCCCNAEGRRRDPALKHNPKQAACMLLSDMSWLAVPVLAAMCASSLARAAFICAVQHNFTSCLAADCRGVADAGACAAAASGLQRQHPAVSRHTRICGRGAGGRSSV